MRKSTISSAPVIGFSLALAAFPVSAAELIEAVGGERCGPRSNSYAVEFLAPDDAELEASATPTVGGSEHGEASPPPLALDGSPCPKGRCVFHATKGQSYTLRASSPGQSPARLCISVTRPSSRPRRDRW